MEAAKRDFFSVAAVVRILRGGVLFAVLGPPIGFAIFALIAELVQSPSASPAPAEYGPFEAFIVAMFFAYPFAAVPASLTGAIVGLVSYKGARERRSWLALKSLVIGSIVSLLYFGGSPLWYWSVLEFRSLESFADLVAVGGIAAVICSVPFYRYINASAGSARVSPLNQPPAFPRGE